MNRRSFFTKLGLAAASLAILPAATTYARNWKPQPTGIWTPNPAWETAEYEVQILMGEPVFDFAFLNRNWETITSANFGGPLLKDQAPMRFTDRGGIFTPVSPFITT